MKVVVYPFFHYGNHLLAAMIKIEVQSVYKDRLWGKTEAIGMCKSLVFGTRLDKMLIRRDIRSFKTFYLLSSGENL